MIDPKLCNMTDSLVSIPTVNVFVILVNLERGAHYQLTAPYARI